MTRWDRLRDVHVPEEQDAEERAWRVVAAAFAERAPAPRQRRTGRVAAVALIAVLAAATIGVAATSAGRSLVTEVRRAIGVERAQPALFSLPAPGRLLVASDAGVWVVQRDGSKRLLRGYREAAWSPFERFVVAARTNELAALEPDGDVRWTLARPGVRFPRWTGSRTDTRIAYADRSGIRVVEGDGTGDRLLAPGQGPLAWRPGTRDLAYVSAREVRVQSTDTGRVVWRANRGIGSPVSRVEWSTDGKRLLVLAERGLRVYDARGRVVARNDPAEGWPNVDAAFRAGTHQIAVARVHGVQSTVFRLGDGRTLFNGTGVFEQVAWSADGTWLVVAWPTADQLVFVQPGSDRRLRAVSDVSRQFRTRSFPRVDSWR